MPVNGIKKEMKRPRVWSPKWSPCITTNPKTKTTSEPHSTQYKLCFVMCGRHVGFAIFILTQVHRRLALHKINPLASSWLARQPVYIVHSQFERKLLKWQDKEIFTWYVYDLFWTRLCHRKLKDKTASNSYSEAYQPRPPISVPPILGLEGVPYPTLARGGGGSPTPNIICRSIYTINVVAISWKISV